MVQQVGICFGCASYSVLEAGVLGGESREGMVTGIDACQGPRQSLC